MKLNKKLTSILVTGAMIASIGGTTAMQAFAAENPTTGHIVNFSKQLNIAQGLTAPEDFTFTFESETPNAPAIAAQVIAMTDATDEDADGFILKNGAVDFDEVTFTTAGVYKYVITETAGTTEGMTYDGEQYEAYIYVKNGEDGELVVDKVIVEKDDGQGGKVKVDVDTPETPEKNEDGTDNKGDEGASGMIFENTFKKVANQTQVEDPDAEDPTAPYDDPDTPVDERKASFVASKTVDGDYGDKVHGWNFTLDIDASATNFADNEYTLSVYKYDKTGKGTDITATYKDGFTLADGEQVAVYGAPVGTVCTIEEVLSNDDIGEPYAASLAVTEKGAEVAEKAVAYNAENKGKDTEVAVLAADGANKADYTNRNTEEDVTPTGILMQNAPYILVATLAAGGLVIYLAKRREEEEEA